MFLWKAALLVFIARGGTYEECTSDIRGAREERAGIGGNRAVGLAATMRFC